MKDTAIIYEWIKDGKKHQKEVSRENFYALFDGISKGFAQMDDNKVSKDLIKIIPEVDKIFINEDNNENQDVPSIAYYVNGEVQLMKIMRRNNIIWSILNKYCTE